MRIDQVGLQLYTIREHTQRDMLGTLRRVAEIGYRTVELAGYGNATAADIRNTLDQLGVRAISAHVALDRFANEPDQVLSELAALGCTYAVVPFVAEERRSTQSQVQQIAADLNRYGELCQRAGLRFAYHNHAFEFAALDGTTMWDVLTTETDPALVALELDVFWAHVAGRDPIQLIEQLSGRLPLLHLKDMTGDDPPRDAPVGAGTLPWAQILSVGDAGGTQGYIVEQDHPRDALNDVRTSFENLQRMARS